MDIAQQLELIRDEAEVLVEEAAETYRAEVLLPFCRKHQLIYLSGNGDFFFCRRTGSGAPGKTVMGGEAPGLEQITADLCVPVFCHDDLFAFYVENVSAADLHSAQRGGK